MADQNAAYAGELRSSEELAECFRRYRWETEEGLHAIAVLHFRGGRTEFELGRRFAESADANERTIGADIISQLGFPKKSFHDESVNLLIRLLGDPVAEVIGSAAVALGHRHDVRAIPALLQLIDHSDPAVRSGVVAGLSQHDHADAIDGLFGFRRIPMRAYAIGQPLALAD